MNFPNADNNSELFMSDKKIILIKNSCNIKKYYIYMINYLRNLGSITAKMTRSYQIQMNLITITQKAKNKKKINISVAYSSHDGFA